MQLNDLNFESFNQHFIFSILLEFFYFSFYWFFIFIFFKVVKIVLECNGLANVFSYLFLNRNKHAQKSISNQTQIQKNYTFK